MRSSPDELLPSNELVACPTPVVAVVCAKCFYLYDGYGFAKSPVAGDDGTLYEVRFVKNLRTGTYSIS